MFRRNFFSFSISNICEYCHHFPISDVGIIFLLIASTSRSQSSTKSCPFDLLSNPSLLCLSCHYPRTSEQHSILKLFQMLLNIPSSWQPSIHLPYYSRSNCHKTLSMLPISTLQYLLIALRFIARILNMAYKTLHHFTPAHLSNSILISAFQPHRLLSVFQMYNVLFVAQDLYIYYFLGNLFLPFA